MIMTTHEYIIYWKMSSNSTALIYYNCSLAECHYLWIVRTMQFNFNFKLVMYFRRFLSIRL